MQRYELSRCGIIKENPKSSITLSLDRVSLDEIRKEADLQGSSVNAKINSILTDYVMFNKYFVEKEAVILDPRIFKFFLETVNENKFLELWNLVNTEIIPTMFLRYNIPYTLENIIKYAFEKIGIQAGIFTSFSHHKNLDNHTLVIEHKYGIKWSRILSVAYSERLEKLTNRRVDAKILPHTIVLEICDNYHSV